LKDTYFNEDTIILLTWKGQFFAELKYLKFS